MEKKSSKKLVVKGVVVALTAILMFIPMLLVWSKIDERESLSLKVSREIGNSWGGHQLISTPYIKIPDDEPKEYYEPDESVKHVSDEVDIKGDVSVEVLHRSIYDVPVYRAGLDMTGTILLDKATVSLARERGECEIFFGITDIKGIEENAVFVLDGKEYEMQPEDGGLAVALNPYELKTGASMEYSLDVKFKGYGSLDFVNNAETFNLSLSSDYPNPGFTGSYLPSERTVTDSGFTANWSLYSQSGYGSYRFGVDFVVPVSQYSQSMRALKYSFLIILLIFSSIFFVEAVSGRPVNIVQYIVTGFSLCLFYLLLLAFTEYMAFWIAYLIASVLTVGSLGAYFVSVLKSRIGYWFAAAVAVFYTFIYVLLQLETSALIIGTLVLFLILLMIMYFTKNLNNKFNF